MSGRCVKRYTEGGPCHRKAKGLSGLCGRHLEAKVAVEVHRAEVLDLVAELVGEVSEAAIVKVAPQTKYLWRELVTAHDRYQGALVASCSKSGRDDS